MRALTLLALLLTMLPGAAHADATPTQVVLVYTPRLATTNTPAASGVAELVLQEGEVRIAVTDLPHLDGDGQYVAWVVGPRGRGARGGRDTWEKGQKKEKIKQDRKKNEERAAARTHSSGYRFSSAGWGD